jgi:uncharacterized protein
MTNFPPPPPTSSWDPGAGSGAPPPAYPTDDERNWAVAAHLGSFVAAWVALGFLAPLTVLLVKGNSSAYVRHHAIESLNFQLNALVWALVGFVLLFALIGFLLLPLVGLWYLTFVILASVRASRGEAYRYPLILRLVT